MSEWRAEINRKALARLDKVLPAIFPQPVLTHALHQTNCHVGMAVACAHRAATGCTIRLYPPADQASYIYIVERGHDVFIAVPVQQSEVGSESEQEAQLCRYLPAR
jgi:hypothetical protein